MFKIVIDGKKVREYFESILLEEKYSCFMCGKMCVVRIINKILNGEKVEFFDKK